MAAALSKEHRAFIGKVMRANRLPLDQYNDANPFEYDTPRAQNLQTMLVAADPVIAAEIKNASSNGYKKSMAVALWEDGEIEMNESIHKELYANDPEYIKMFNARQQENEARIMAGWEENTRASQIARGVDPDALNQKYNPALGGSKFKSYFEGLNQEAALERKMQQEKNTYQPKL